MIFSKKKKSGFFITGKSFFSSYKAITICFLKKLLAVKISYGFLQFYL